MPLHHQGKIFGVGLSRTGTLSLATALRLLGYHTIHYPFTMEEILQHDASVDISVSARFIYLSRLYPESKFILTTRELDPWLASCEAHYADPWRTDDPATWDSHKQAIAENDFTIYGTWMYDKEMFIQAKQRHESMVREWIPCDRLLEVNITEDANVWSHICRFLGFSEIPFPWEHKGC